MKYEIGNLIAIQDNKGHVYTGLVSSVDEHQYTVDILADGEYHRQEISYEKV